MTLVLINLNVSGGFQAQELVIKPLQRQWKIIAQNLIPGIVSGQQVLHFLLFSFLAKRIKQKATLSAILSSKMPPSRAILSSSRAHVLNEHTVNIATVLWCTPLWFVRSGSY